MPTASPQPELTVGGVDVTTEGDLGSQLGGRVDAAEGQHVGDVLVHRHRLAGCERAQLAGGAAHPTTNL